MWAKHHPNTSVKYHPSITQIWQEAGWEGGRSSELGWCSQLRTSPSCTWSWVIMNLVRMFQSWYLPGLLGPVVPEFFSWQNFFQKTMRNLTLFISFLCNFSEIFLRCLFHFYVIFQKFLLQIGKCRIISVLFCLKNCRCGIFLTTVKSDFAVVVEMRRMITLLFLFI